MNPYTSHFLPFLKRCVALGPSFLVACSGGPDSMTLLRMMADYRKTNGTEFGVAHVDHGWRKESGDEVRALEKLCAEMDVPFYLERIDPNSLRGNLEDVCRKIRKKFFVRMCLEYNYQSVLLGHHLDDQAETVLKRLFEGARLEKCGGMQEVSVYEGVPFARPFLQVRKKQLIEWLKSRKCSYFLDPTNNDNSLLRSRFRGEILPQISRQFGKEASPGLAFIGREARALNDFMGAHLRRWLILKESAPLGTLWDLRDCCPAHLFEARCLISEIMPQASREIAYTAAEALIEGAANKSFQSGGQTLYMDRRRIILTPKAPLDIPDVEVPLEESGSIGCWTYRVQPATKQRLSGWKQALYGVFQMPLGDNLKALRICSPAAAAHCQRTLNKMRTQEKVPAFMKNWAPVITRNDEVVLDFLCASSGQRTEAARHEIILTKAIH